MKNTNEKILATITTEQWAAIAEYARKMSTHTSYEEHTPTRKESSNVEIYRQVTNIMTEIGLPANIKGYQYFRAAVILACEDWSYVDNVTSSLYPKIAKDFNTTPSRVERAIRHAIEVVFSYGDIEILHSYFLYSESKRKPTNSEAIATIADYLKLNA